MNPPPMIDELRRRLNRYEHGLDMNDPAFAGRDRAAVLIPVVPGDSPGVILTLRSSRLDAHAGEVAWPGGKRDPEDDSLLTTALREAREEIGLAPEQVEIIGELRPFISKFGLLVTPFAGIVAPSVALTPNPRELEDIFDVPLGYLLDDPRTETNVISRHGETHHVPVYYYGQYRIWGLTAMILREFLIQGLGAGIA